MKSVGLATWGNAIVQKIGCKTTLLGSLKNLPFATYFACLLDGKHRDWFCSFLNGKVQRRTKGHFFAIQRAFHGILQTNLRPACVAKHKIFAKVRFGKPHEKCPKQRKKHLHFAQKSATPGGFYQQKGKLPVVRLVAFVEFEAKALVAVQCHHKAKWAMDCFVANLRRALDAMHLVLGKDVLCVCKPFETFFGGNRGGVAQFCKHTRCKHVGKSTSVDHANVGNLLLPHFGARRLFVESAKWQVENFGVLLCVVKGKI